MIITTTTTLSVPADISATTIVTATLTVNDDTFVSLKGTAPTDVEVIVNNDDRSFVCRGAASTVVSALNSLVTDNEYSDYVMTLSAPKIGGYPSTQNGTYLGSASSTQAVGTFGVNKRNNNMAYSQKLVVRSPFEVEGVDLFTAADNDAAWESGYEDGYEDGQADAEDNE